MTAPALLPKIAAAPARPLRAWQAEALPVALAALDGGERGVIQACTGAGKSVFLAEILAQRPPGEGEAIVVTTPTQSLVEQLWRTLGARLGVGWVGRYYARRKEAYAPVVVTCHPSAAQLAAELRRRGRQVSLWIADECHKTESPEMHEAADLLAPAAAIGCTATPFRSERGQSLSLWNTVLYSYTPGDALRDGVIVPWRVVPWSGGEEVHIDDAAIEMILAAPDGPGVVNAVTIDGAESFAARLTANGVPSVAVHSRLSAREQAARLARLAAGDLRCVVYPSLLSEGFDMPCLRWMCLRRGVKARVRFIQEIGRVLRTAPGKTEAVILDPLGLIEQHSLTYTATLGWPDDDDDDGDDDREQEPAQPLLDDGDAEPTYAKPVDQVGSWARQLCVAALADGVATPPEGEFVTSASSRDAMPSTRQVGALKKMSWAARWLPPSHAMAVSAVVDRGAVHSAGLASDLLDVLCGLARHKQPWSPPSTVAPPPIETISAARAQLDEGGWYAAGAVRDGLCAIAVVKGRRVVHCEVKRWPSATTSAAQIVAIRYAARLARQAGVELPVIHCKDNRTERLATGRYRPREGAETQALAVDAPEHRVTVGTNCPAWRQAWSALGRRQRRGQRRAS